MGAAAVLATAVAGAGIYSSITQAKAGKAQSKDLLRQGEYNAQLYEQQASMIQEQKKLQDYQYNRVAARARGSIISRTAGNGLLLSGSPLSILVDSETQMMIDQATRNYNSDVERNYVLSAAKASREDAYYKAKLARSTGYSNAFTTLMNTGANMAMIGAFSGSGAKTGGKA